MEKNITCAVLNIVNDRFLVCHATLSPFWTLPKGIKENGESFRQAAVREMYEETGIKIDINTLFYSGLFGYKKGKDMVVFKYEIDTELDVKKMDCISTFYTSKSDKLFKEVDSYKYVTLNEAKYLLNKAQYNIVKKIIKE